FDETVEEIEDGVVENIDELFDSGKFSCSFIGDAYEDFGKSSSDRDGEDES
ncbi:11624_t:CDS:1, partial [Cetraspora pellucida]